MLTAIGTQTIETPRLILRRFAKGDGKSAFRNWCSDASVTTYLKWSAHSYPLITEQVVARWAREYHDPHCLHWAITRKSHGDVIGGVSLTVKDLMGERAGPGYSLRIRPGRTAPHRSLLRLSEPGVCRTAAPSGIPAGGSAPGHVPPCQRAVCGLPELRPLCR